MMTHEEASDSLAAFALDAVEHDESELIQAHVARCPRCQAEVDAHRELAAALGNSVVPLPAGLWESISRRLTRSDDGEGVLGVRSRSPTIPRVEARHGRRGTMRSSRPRFVTAAFVAVGAASLATVLGISLADANNQIARLQAAVRETAQSEIVAATKTPGHAFVNLTDVRHGDVAEFVVLPNGRGYLVKSELPALPTGETYQLWGLSKDKTISLGLLGRAPHLATFTSAGSPRAYRLGVTVEAAGGALQPSGPMLAAGTT